MSNRIDDAAARAAAARRAAEAAARRAAEAAQRAAAAAAARAATAQVKPQGDGFSTTIKPLTLREPPVVTVAPQTKADEAQAEVSRLQSLAKTDPAAAAKGLKEGAKNADPAYRDAFLKNAGPVVAEISKSLDGADAEVIQNSINDVLAAGHAGGPETSKAFGKAFASTLDGRGLGGYHTFGDIVVPEGAGSAAVLTAMLGGKAGTGDFVLGLREGAKETGNDKLNGQLDTLVKGSTKLTASEFKKASDKVDQLNGELNNLVQGFGKDADPAKLQAAVQAFKERHKDEYAKFESLSKGLLNTLAVEGPRLTSGKTDLLKGLELKSLTELLPKALASEAGQAELGKQLEAQARGEPSLLDTLGKVAEAGGDDVKAKLAPLITQALGARITALKADGKVDEAHALIDTLGKNAAVFGIDASKMKEVQDAMHDVLDGTPGALETLNLATSSINTLLPDVPGGSTPGGSTVPQSRAQTALKSLGFAVGVAGLPNQFGNLSDQELHQQIGTIASTLGLGADGGSLAIKTLASPGALASLDRLFGKVSVGAGIIGAVTSTIDFGKTLENGSIGDIAVSGLNAASSVLLLIPGGQIAGVGLAIASFALAAFLGDRRQREAEKSSEKDALAFLKARGLNEDFAKVFSNLNNDKQNIGTFVDEVAKKLGLTQEQFFQKLNASSGEDRQKLLLKFTQLSVYSELVGEFDDDKKLPIFGPRPTVDDIPSKVGPIEISDEQKKKIIAKFDEERQKVVDQTAKDIGPLL